MSRTRPVNRSDLVRIAAEVMAERGLEPEFPAAVHAQLATITGPGSDGIPASAISPGCPGVRSTTTTRSISTSSPPASQEPPAR